MLRKKSTHINVVKGTMVLPATVRDDEGCGGLESSA